VAGEAEIARAAALLVEGALVAFPTETVYGLGAHALDPVAVAAIFEAKGRPTFDPLIVHLADAAELGTVAASVPAAAARLAERFWPGPLTLVLPKRQVVPDLVTAGHPTVGVRVPRHPMAQALLRAARIPVAAPSANPFGAISPTRAEHVAAQLGDRVRLILDGGPCEVGVESTIVAFDADGAPLLLRPGGVALEALEAVAGPVSIPAAEALTTLSPGRLERHYAPGTPLTLLSAPLPRSAGELPSSGRLGLLAARTPPTELAARFREVRILSTTGDLAESAANLFAELRALDAAGLEALVAEPVPEIGLGRAIMDRLRRAQARRPG
jgi:L-threonylcarbamoyladenylate synthase